MSDKKEKLSHAAHIKRHTEGTSNELSFSVLDAARNLADAEEGKDGKAKTPRLGRIPLFSLPVGRKKTVATPAKDNVLPLSGGEASYNTNDPAGSPVAIKASIAADGAAAAVAGQAIPVPKAVPAYPSPADEVARRKSRRRKRKRTVAAVTSVVVVAALAVLGYLGLTEYNKNQSHVSLLQQSLDKVATTDEVIGSVDKLVNDPTDSSVKQTGVDLVARFPETKKALAEAEALVGQAAEGISNPNDKEAANQALAAIGARRDLLESGEDLLMAENEVKVASEEITEAWKVVLTADAAARDAATLVADTSNENVQASRGRTVEAQSLFSEAKATYEKVAGYTIAPDLKSQIDYLDTRIEAMQHAIASDDALIAQDKQTADQENDAYNTADNKAIELAYDLPSDPTQPISAAYRKSTEEPRKRYDLARSKASAADAFLRDYLGT